MGDIPQSGNEVWKKQPVWTRLHLIYLSRGTGFSGTSTQPFFGALQTRTPLAVPLGQFDAVTATEQPL